MGWFVFFATASVLSEKSFSYKIVQKVTEKIYGMEYYPGGPNLMSKTKTKIVLTCL
jgi:hypothetical protein